MNTAAKLDPRVSEFETVEEKNSYDIWLSEKVKKARKSPRLTQEQSRERTHAALLKAVDAKK